MSHQLEIILFPHEEIEEILKIIEESDGKDAILLSRLRTEQPETFPKVEELLRVLRPINTK